jgi:hypothetical protein
MHEIIIGIARPGISYQRRDIYSICWNVAIYNWKVNDGKTLSFAEVNRRSYGCK